jgi:adenine-specific DNA-methyltransferase
MAKADLKVTTLRHKQAKRRNIPTAELEPVMRDEDKSPLRLAYERRNRDLDPQLVWRGKDQQDWSDLIVQAPPLYIQEKVHPKVLIDDLLRQSKARAAEASPQGPDLFADFNGLPDKKALTEFYQHNANWSNRMILGDSLSVMASLAEREGLRGQVQCIYVDPPYGIKFNSNFQWSTTSRDVKDGNREHITREPEQVKAFRDTWREGIHSYLTYLRDRLTVARELLTDSGSIFVQIGDENVHRVRAVIDEVFGEDNAGPIIDFKTTSGLTSDLLSNSTDHLLWYFRDRGKAKFRRLFNKKAVGEQGATQFTLIQSPDALVIRTYSDDDQNRLNEGWQLLAHDNLTSTGFATTTKFDLSYQEKIFQLPAGNVRWKSPPEGIERLGRASRIMVVGKTPRYRRLLADCPVFPIVDLWTDTGISGFADKKGLCCSD